jgi:hypothetical protein
MMRSPALSVPLMALLLTGCIQSDSKYPSLLPREIESQSTAEPTRAPVTVAPDPALDKRIADLTAQLDKAQTDFSAAAQGAEAKVAVARGLPEGSEPWIDANVALAGLDVLRGQASDALEALEQLAIERGRGGQPPYPALDAAIARARALADDQARRIRTLESSLAN